MGKKVLVVEDDSSVRLTVCHYLRGMGWQVEEAESGAAALQALSDSSEPIDLVLADYRLPDIDGRELARRFHSDCPFVFMTGSSADVLSLPGPVLRKPFGEEALRKALTRVVPERTTSRGGF